MSERPTLDEALRKILEVACEQKPGPLVPPIVHQSHSAAWPWQVPQVPTYTSNNGMPYDLK